MVDFFWCGGCREKECFLLFFYEIKTQFSVFFFQKIKEEQTFFCTNIDMIYYLSMTGKKKRLSYKVKHEVRERKEKNNSQ